MPIPDDEEPADHADDNTINPPTENDDEARPDAKAPVEKGDPFGAARPGPLAMPISGKGAAEDALPRTADPTLLLPEDRERIEPGDRDLLAWVVLLRLASYRQLQALIGGDRHVSTLRKRITDLIERGFLQPWDRPGRGRRGQRYVLPTSVALRLVIPFLRNGTAHETYAPLVQAMLPTQRRPFVLDAKSRKWLSHQLEVNELATRVRLARPAVIFTSTWEAPFPTTLDFLDAPQPDSVLVEEEGGVQTIVFGEHDRGTGTIAAFIARKIELYAGLASFPDIVAKELGVARFRVDVTVIDVERQNPLGRLRALIDAAAASTHPELFRFTLGGWLYAYTNENVWFSSARVPEIDSLHFPDHVLPANA